MAQKYLMDLRMQSEGVLTSLDDLMTNITKARYRQSQAKLAFRKAEDRFSNVTRDGTMALLAAMPHLEELEEQMRNWNVQVALEKDEAWVKEFTLYSDAQEELYNAEVSLIDLSERLGTTKSQARLLSAMLQLLSEDTDGG